MALGWTAPVLGHTLRPDDAAVTLPPPPPPPPFVLRVPVGCCVGSPSDTPLQVPTQALSPVPLRHKRAPSRQINRV